MGSRAFLNRPAPRVSARYDKGEELCFPHQGVHQRWRARERTALATTSPETLSAYLPLLKIQVSNVGAMGKEGHSYWPVTNQVAAADRIADQKGCDPQERASLKKRLPRASG